MAFKISTGLRNALLSSDDYIALMAGKIFRCYSGAVPTNAQDSLGAAVLLGTISLNGAGTGVTFEAAPVNGMAVKKTSEAWTFVITAAGTPSFYRHVDLADDGTASASAYRAQGSIGLLNADLIVNSVAWTIGMSLPDVSAYAVGLPGE